MIEIWVNKLSRSLQKVEYFSLSAAESSVTTKSRVPVLLNACTALDNAKKRRKKSRYMVQHEHPIDRDELIKESRRRRVHLESLPRLAALHATLIQPCYNRPFLPTTLPTIVRASSALVRSEFGCFSSSTGAYGFHVFYVTSSDHVYPTVLSNAIPIPTVGIT